MSGSAIPRTREICPTARRADLQCVFGRGVDKGRQLGMGTTYEIWCGGRLVAIRNTTSSPRQAAIEYVSSLGCGLDEVVKHGRSAIAWQGSVYRAVPLGSMESSPASVARWSTHAAAA